MKFEILLLKENMYLYALMFRGVREKINKQIKKLTTRKIMIELNYDGVRNKIDRFLSRH